jgi:hypothetical protein
MKNYIEKAMTFAEYAKLIDELLAAGKTTGPNQSEAMVGFTRLNRQRMERLAKTTTVIDEVKNALSSIERKMTWLIITEGWCGDAAQNVPAIEKMAAECDLIETRYLLRDENPELIDQFVTSGARAIPKLIAIDSETFEVLGSWGAGPKEAQRLFERRRDEGILKPQIMEELQRWYNADRSLSLQKEFAELAKGWGTKSTATARA